VYDLFDDVMLLSNGRIVFHGARPLAHPYFSGLGFICPERKASADFLQVPPPSSALHSCASVARAAQPCNWFYGPSVHCANSAGSDCGASDLYLPSQHVPPIRRLSHRPPSPFCLCCSSVTCGRKIAGSALLQRSPKGCGCVLRVDLQTSVRVGYPENASRLCVYSSEERVRLAPHFAPFWFFTTLPSFSQMPWPSPLSRVQSAHIHLVLTGRIACA
jgi:ABC-2 type transporter